MMCEMGVGVADGNGDGVTAWPGVGVWLAKGAVNGVSCPERKVGLAVGAGACGGAQAPRPRLINARKVIKRSMLELYPPAEGAFRRSNYYNLANFDKLMYNFDYQFLQ